MLRTYMRPMTETERQEAEGHLLHYTATLRSHGNLRAEAFRRRFHFLVLGVITAVLIGRFLSLKDIPAARLTLLIAVVIAVALAEKRVRYGEEYQKRGAQRFAQRLVRGEVEVTEVVASDVVKVVPQESEEEEYKDIEPMFLFDIGSDQVLVLSGEYFLTDVNTNTESPYDPHGVFEIVRYPDAPYQVESVRLIRAPLPVSRTVYWSDYSSAEMLSDGEVLTSISLAHLERDRPDLFRADSD